MRKRKPWGDSAHFCPLALLEQGVLWPGNQDTAAKYRERLYYFSSEEAKEQFTVSPKEYTASGGPLEVGLRFGIIKYTYQAPIVWGQWNWAPGTTPTIRHVVSTHLL